MAERLAAIDVGTNTVLLLVAERRGDALAPLLERAEITRLGRGVDASGRLDAAAIRDTTAVLAAYVRDARRLGAARIACVATSAARDAANGAEFFEAARAAAGLAPEVISGEEEARLVWASAWRDFGGRGGPLAVLDVGGGSTEFTFGDGPRPAGRTSLQVGAVRLTERHVRGDPVPPAELAALRAAAREALRPLAAMVPSPSPRPSPPALAAGEGGGGGANVPSPPALAAGQGRGGGANVPSPPALAAGQGRGGGAWAHAGGRLVGVAGTVTTLCSVAQALPVYDAERVHGAALSLAEIEALVDRLAGLTVKARAALPGMEPKRADVIVAGALVVAEAMRATGFDRLTVSDRGVRWGLLYDRFGP